MVQNNVNKTTKVMWSLMEKTDELNRKFNALVKEILTEDIKKMIDEINKAEYRDYFLYEFPNCYLRFGYEDDKGKSVSMTLYDVSGISRRLPCVCSFENYNDTIESYLAYLKTAAERYKRRKEWYDLLYNNVEDIIDYITEKYKNCVTDQSKLIDDIFSCIGEDKEPTKHIKITVEYVNDEEQGD